MFLDYISGVGKLRARNGGDVHVFGPRVNCKQNKGCITPAGMAGLSLVINIDYLSHLMERGRENFQYLPQQMLLLLQKK